jgi:hypothetical protein
MPPSEANPTLARTLARLERYGYRATIADDAETWRKLRGDFEHAAEQELAALPPATKAAAEHYLACKRKSDRLLTACETAHAEILERGLDRERSEAYAIVRDAYEDSVEAFGTAGAEVARSLKA